MRLADQGRNRESIRRGSIALVAMLVVGWALSTPVAAQSLEQLVPDFTPEESDILKRGFGRYTSFVTVFTSRNGASSGNFSAGAGDADFSVNSIPLSYSFGEDTDELRFKVRGAFGQYNSSESISLFSEGYTEIEPYLPSEYQELPNEDDFRRDSVLSLTMGGGFEYRPTKNLLIEPAFDLVWTHIKRRFNYGNFMSSLFGSRYDRDLFNTSLEAITYAPSIHAKYEVGLGEGYALIPEVTYTHLWSYDLWSKSKFADFSIDSGVLQSKVALSVPLSTETFSRDIDLRPYVVRTDLYRAVKESFGESVLWDFGVDIAVEVKDSWISELRFGGAYIYSGSLEGYRVNVGAEF